MLNIIHSIVLGILQGFTEFLPVSSSAHLILLPKLMGWQDFGLGFDVAIHFGSLIAIIAYFLRVNKLEQAYKNFNLSKLFGLIMLATVPVGVAGIICNKYIAVHARSISMIAATTIIFGILLGVAYYFNNKLPYKNQRGFADLSIKYAIFIGLAQAVAIIPGVSRSGITITFALFCGFHLVDACKISFMMAIPVIMAAGFKQTWELLAVNSLVFDPTILMCGFFSSMLSSFIFVFLLFKYVAKIGIWPFVIYRILLGLCLISS